MARPKLVLKTPYNPETLKAAAEHIAGLLTVESEVFEFGSGGSTLWLLVVLGVKRVVTVEHDNQWYDEVARVIASESKKSRSKLLLVDPADIPEIIKRYAEESFDMVLVDCLDRQRTQAVFNAMPHVKPGGYLVIDDSHWPMLRTAVDFVRAAGWKEALFDGNHKRWLTGETRHHQCIVFQRPTEPDDEEE